MPTGPMWSMQARQSEGGARPPHGLSRLLSRWSAHLRTCSCPWMRAISACSRGVSCSSSGARASTTATSVACAPGWIPSGRHRGGTGERFAGDNKYSASKLFKLAFDGIFAFSIVPLRAAAFLGRDRRRAVHALRALCPVREALPEPVAPGLHRAHPAHHLPLGRAPVLPWRHRRVRGPGVRGGEGTADLYRWPAHAGRKWT